MSIAIRIEHVSKEYRLGVINHGMLYKDIQSWIARGLGKPDPHAAIGAERYADQADRFWALKDVCLDIKQGDRLGIIGKNGAGEEYFIKSAKPHYRTDRGVHKNKGACDKSPGGRHRVPWRVNRTRKYLLEWRHTRDEKALDR